MIWTINFWQGVAERAVKTFFQVFGAVVGLNASGIGENIGLGDVDWLGTASIAAVAAILSIVTTIGNADFTAGGGVPKRAVTD